METQHTACNIMMNWKFLASFLPFFLYLTWDYFRLTSLQWHWFLLSLIFLFRPRALWLRLFFGTAGTVTDYPDLRPFVQLWSTLALPPILVDRRRLVCLCWFLVLTFRNVHIRPGQACKSSCSCLNCRTGSPLSYLTGWIVAEAHCQKRGRSVHNPKSRMVPCNIQRNLVFSVESRRSTDNSHCCHRTMLFPKSRHMPMKQASLWKLTPAWKRPWPYICELCSVLANRKF